MPRKAVKTLKHSLLVARGEAEIMAATVALLRHSLRFGHRRLALRRLEKAVECGAELNSDDLFRCTDLVLSLNDADATARLARLSQQVGASRLA